MKVEVGEFTFSGDVSGETEELIQELESFYQFDIEWNREEADQKLADFLESENE